MYCVKIIYFYFQAYYRYMVATAVYYGADKESQNIIMLSWYRTFINWFFLTK